MEFKNAKEMYFYFDGSSFHMDREGYYDQYKAFNISDQQERIWRQELIEFTLKKLPADRGALSTLHVMEAFEALPALMKYSNYGDGFFKCRLAETLHDIVYKTFISDRTGFDIEILIEAENKSKRILEELTQEPGQENEFILHEQILVDNAYIIDRAKDNLERFKDLSTTLDKYKK